MERLAIDITGPHPRSRNGFKYIFTAVDVFSKWAIAIPVRSHEATTVASLLVDKVFSVIMPVIVNMLNKGENYNSTGIESEEKLIEVHISKD